MTQRQSTSLFVLLAAVLCSPLGCAVDDDTLAAADAEPDQSHFQDEDGGYIHGDDGQAVLDAVTVTQQELARIDVGNGEIVYSVDLDGPAAGELTVLETFEPDADGQLRMRDTEDLSPLELYLSVTADDVPVPEALIAAEQSSDVRSMAEHRGASARIAGVIKGIEPPEGTPMEIWSAATMCAQGTTSAMFAAEICTIDDHWTKNFCHNGTWHSVTDATGSTHKAEWSRSRTLACGANGRARHYYKVGGIWYKTIDGTIPSGTVYRFTREGGAKWQRKITHSRTASGFVRGASHFFRFPF